MRHLLTTLLRRPSGHHLRLQLVSYSSKKTRPSPTPPEPHPPPSPPKPPKKRVKMSLHGDSWEDQYNWMSQINDKVAMRHMCMALEQEEKYTEAVMFDTDRLQSTLFDEMSARMVNELSTPPVLWGPWLYYKRIEEGKHYRVLCRRLASLHKELLSNKSPSAGFDFISGKTIEEKLLDYNQEAERFGGYAFEGVSDVSPDHHYLAYTMYDKENDYFKLSVRDLNFKSLCSKPDADRVSDVAWANDGKSLLYVVTDENERPYRIYCSMIGSKEDDVLLVEESQADVHLHLRHTRDFHFLTVNALSPTSSKAFLINAADPLSGLKLVWECDSKAHCIIEHHQGYLYLFTDAAKQGQIVDHHYLSRCSVVSACSSMKWEEVFADDQHFIIENVDICDSHMVLTVRDGRKFGLYSVSLPLSDDKVGACLKEFNPHILPLPNHVSQILPAANCDFYSSTMCFTITSPVMPDALVEYDLQNGKWTIVQQQNVFHERTRILYGSSSSASIRQESNSGKFSSSDGSDDCTWNELSDYYACEQYRVPSCDGASVPLTVVYSHHRKTDGENPGLLHVHGSYGEILDKRWRSERRSLLDRGWILAYADVRGGGGGGRKWHHDGMQTKKLNSIKDYIACAKFLVERKIVEDTKLAGWGYSAGGLLVASAINLFPDLFRAAVLKVPFLDPTNTLMQPIIPLLDIDYEEFGYPEDIEDFRAIREYSPYDNIKKDVMYPAILITLSPNARFGVWEAAKWAARMREYSYDPSRPVLLSLTTDVVEDNRYAQCKESALETAFLLTAVDTN